MQRIIFLVQDFAQPIEVLNRVAHFGPITNTPKKNDTVILQVTRQSLLAQVDLIASLEEREVNIIFVTQEEDVSRQIYDANIRNSLLIRTPKAKTQIKKLIQEFLNRGILEA